MTIDPTPYASANAFIRAAFSVGAGTQEGVAEGLHLNWRHEEGRKWRQILDICPGDKLILTLSTEDGYVRQATTYLRCSPDAPFGTTEASIAGQLNARLGTGRTRNDPERPEYRRRTWRVGPCETATYLRQHKIDDEGVVDVVFMLRRTFTLAGSGSG